MTTNQTRARYEAMAKEGAEALARLSIDISDGQKHFGTHAKNGKSLWHTNEKGLLWCGSWYYRTPSELLEECESTARDLRAYLSARTGASA
jgi:hypothetical protein